jgi:hypothetical protein
MLLAAEEGDRLALLTPEKDLPAGTQISSGMEPGQKPVSFKEFQRLEIRVGAIAPGEPAMLDVGSRKLPCAVEKPEDGKKYAAFIARDKAMVIHGPEKIKIVFDKEIPVGAKIR